MGMPQLWLRLLLFFCKTGGMGARPKPDVQGQLWEAWEPAPAPVGCLPLGNLGGVPDCTCLHSMDARCHTPSHRLVFFSALVAQSLG